MTDGERNLFYLQRTNFRQEWSKLSFAPGPAPDIEVKGTELRFVM
jgi:hypothetical protein